MVKVLGIRFGHDAAASLVVDGRIVADAQEERFTRAKNDGSFPLNAISYCLKSAGVTSAELDALAIPSLYRPPEYGCFFRLPKDDTTRPSPSLRSRVKHRMGAYMSPDRPAVPSSPSLPLYVEPLPLREDCQILQVHHHLAHASSAYYTYGRHEGDTLVATLDGRGDGVSVALWRGEKGRLEPLVEYDGFASLGWFYSAVTEALDWRHGSDEWKTMGLAPYGTPQPGLFDGFHPVFRDGELVVGHDFGTPGRWLDHGANHYHLDDAAALKEILGTVSREDFAAEAQRVVEEQMEQLLFPWLERLGTRTLCCAGGVFLNVKMNQRIWYSGKVDTQWIFPNPGDSGLAAGAALWASFSLEPDLHPAARPDMYLGPEFDRDEIRRVLEDRKLDYSFVSDVPGVAAEYLADNKIVAWFQGRMESGPRALGHRSILMSPLRAEHKDIINAAVKYREAFRPFCPSLLWERADDYLVDCREEPYMITSFDVRPEKRDAIPAVVHVDGTVRPQTVRRETNPMYWELISRFEDLTGEAVILNTSFNVKGEPVICTPREAIRCFFDTGLDVLIMGNFVLTKPGVAPPATGDE